MKTLDSDEETDSDFDRKDNAAKSTLKIERDKGTYEFLLIFQIH